MLRHMVAWAIQIKSEKEACVQEVEELLGEIILSNLLCSEEVTINFETNLIKDIGMDSISLVTMVILIENKFNIELPDEFFTEDNLSKFCNVVSTIQTILNTKK